MYIFKIDLDNIQDFGNKTGLSFLQIKFPIKTTAVQVRPTVYWDLATSSGRKGPEAKAFLWFYKHFFYGLNDDP
jgi:hypothetical protein